MNHLVVFVIAVFIPSIVLGQAQEVLATDTTAELAIPATVDTNLNDFLWVARPVVVFADSPADPQFKKQIALLEELPDELSLRDVVVITDTDPSANTPLREELRPRGFMMVLIGKDGTVLLRKPLPWDVRELSRSIDKLPARQQEMRDRRVPPK